MTVKRTPRPRDPIQLGKLMVDIATGAVPDGVDDGKDAKTSEARKAAGMHGGLARAASLNQQARGSIAKQGAAARWARKRSGPD